MEKTENKNLQSQRNTTKFNSLIVMLFLSFLSCSNESKETVYKYNSIEYNEKLKTFKINLEDASNIASQTYFKSNPNLIEYNFTLGNYYIFSSPSRKYNLKTTEYFLTGIWVNGLTEEIIYKNTDEYVKVLLDIPSSDLTSYSETIKREN